MADNDNQPGRADKAADRPAKKRADEAKPLAEEIEEAMLGEDIPVETGVRPGNGPRKP